MEIKQRRTSEHLQILKCSICKSSWAIDIKIIAEIKSFTGSNNICKEICDGIWFSVIPQPLVKGEVFWEEDIKWLIEGIKYVREMIIKNSKYGNKTWIEIGSLQFSICDFQEDALPIAMMYWAAKSFGFEMPDVEVTFDKTENRYLFEF